MFVGCYGDLGRCLELANETPSLVRRPNNQLEKFLLRRAQKMLNEDEKPNQQYCLLLGYELLYLWNALGACLKHSHLAIQIGKFEVLHNQICILYMLYKNVRAYYVTDLLLREAFKIYQCHSQRRVTYRSVAGHTFKE